MNFTVISFFTSDWLYPEYAKLLENDCKKLGLKYCIKPFPSLGEYTKNCNIKPSFILDQLSNLKSPVLWMDVDGSLLKRPEILFDNNIEKYDIAGNRPFNNKERIHVGSIWFNYTNKTLEFLKMWDETAQSSIDDAAFNKVWNKFKNDLSMLDLPSDYFFIHKNDTDIIPSETVILHRLSSSDLKWKYKKKVEKK
jgi:hypothetical protein